GRDANQLRLALQRWDRPAPAIAHAGAQAAHELVDHGGDAAFVRDTPLDAFRHQLVAAARRLEIELVLEIPVAAAAPHGPNRSHAAVFLEAASLVENDFAGALVRAGEEVAHHHRARADGEGLRDVAGEADPAVRDDRDVAGRGGAGAFHDGAD